MLQNLKYAMVGAAVLAAFAGGYSIADMRGNLEIERLKKENAQAVINAQASEKAKYEKQIENLVTDRAAEREHFAERLRELEQFERSGSDLAACRRDRSRLASLAVRFEKLTIRAINDLKTTLRGQQN